MAVLLLREAVLGGRVFFQRDIHMWWVPRMEAFVRSVHAGSWPWWDAWRAFGQSNVGDPSGQVYYPFTWLNLLLLPGPSYTVFLLGHSLLSSAGIYVLLRRWQVSPAASFVAGTLWMASPLLALLTLPHHLSGAAWMPWVLAATDRVLAERTPRAVSLCALTLALQIVAGSADMTAMSWTIAGVLALAQRPPLRSWVALAGAAVLALALAAAQIAPTVAMARGAERFQHGEASRTWWSVHPLALLELVTPLRWASLPLPADWGQALAREGDPWLTTLYLGVPAFVLAAGAFVPERSPRRWPLLSVGVACCLIALGRHAPFYGWMIAAVPPLSVLRFPVKAMVAGGLAWSLLAALGWDAWAGDASRARRWVVAVLPAAAALFAACALFGLAVLGIVPIVVPLRDASAVAAAIGARVALSVVVAAVMLVLAVARARAPQRRRTWAAVAGVLAVGSVVGAHLRLEPTAAPAALRHRPAALAWVPEGSRVFVRDHIVSSRAERRRGDSAPTPYGVARVPESGSLAEGLMLGAQSYLNPPVAIRWGVRGSYDLDLLGLYDPWLRDMTEAFREAEADPPRALRLLQIGGVQHVLALRDAPAWQALGLLATVPGFFELPIRVFRVPEPLADAYAVSAAEIATDFPSSLARLLEPTFDPRTTVLLSDGVGRGPAAGFRGEANVTLRKPDQLRVATRFSSDGLLVLLEGYDPGWRATVDGKPAVVRRANAIFRAVDVPAGDHVVEMVYRPRAVVGGLAVSMVAAAVVAALFLIPRRD